MMATCWFNRSAAKRFSRYVGLCLIVGLLWTGCSGIRSYPRYTLNHKHGRMHRAIQSYLGTPYRWGGEDRQGVDCSGLVVVVFRQAVGMSLPHSTDELYSMGRGVARSRIRHGDLVFFSDSGRTPTHVGIGLGGTRFIHASSGQGVVISDLETDYFKQRYIGARRLRW
jgi:hypothetical protein